MFCQTNSSWSGWVWYSNINKNVSSVHVNKYIQQKTEISKALLTEYKMEKLGKLVRIYQSRQLKSISSLQFRFHSTNENAESNAEQKESERIRKFREKLKKNPEEILQEAPHPGDQFLPPWPNNTNPHTGEVNGPKGPEPTRYGDWERKGRVSDF